MAISTVQQRTRERVRKAAALAALSLAAGFGATASHAALFEDDEARRAILELRQRVDALQQQLGGDQRRSSDETSQMRRSLIDLQSQIETLRSEQASLRGQNEQLQRDVSDLQRRQKDIAQGVDERLKQFEPAKVTMDGQEFQADPAEKRDFEAALAVFRSGKFPDAVSAFGNFLRQYPRSGYMPSARFWLGNAQYATRDYKEAINNFKALLAASPDHARAPEAALSIANCQIELKDTRAARKTLEDLLRAYPQSEAAAAAKERLARLK
ncbi:tol-pal system protein YbgF [Paracidovorax avenae]|uniref:tol-pal system protein YbgF n=1 Tax=Paracidovorax avenae TaxID=80867 RepID=UPI000D157EAB|nr:tol-pal system protein YbgF [Paracidovorax avenae]AVT20054.1 tol-pal system protein YbgF [Paracidovorax avenae]